MATAVDAEETVWVIVSLQLVVQAKNAASLPACRQTGNAADVSATIWVIVMVYFVVLARNAVVLTQYLACQNVCQKAAVADDRFPR